MIRGLALRAAAADLRGDGGRRGTDLVDELLARPDDLALRLVIADRLQEAGDPRGELMAVQCALASSSRATSAVSPKTYKRLATREAALVGRALPGLDLTALEVPSGSSASSSRRPCSTARPSSCRRCSRTRRPGCSRARGRGRATRAGRHRRGDRRAAAAVAAALGRGRAAGARPAVGRAQLPRRGRRLGRAARSRGARARRAAVAVRVARGLRGLARGWFQRGSLRQAVLADPARRPRLEQG